VAGGGIARGRNRRVEACDRENRGNPQGLYRRLSTTNIEINLMVFKKNNHFSLAGKKIYNILVETRE
jgi:hypothetical protein